MPKTIFTVDVDDTKFRAFTQIFDKYQTALKTTPEAWAKVTKGIDGSRKSFDFMVAGLVAAQGKAKLMAEAQKQIDLSSRTAADKWRDIARSTKSATGNIISATASLAKWAGLTAAFSGLIGAGSLFGIDKLANAVSAGRRSSLGLGLSYGEQQAFGVNYGRIVDPDTFLSGVNQSLHSAQGRVALYGAGLTPNQMQGDTAQVAVALLPALKKIADNTNPAVYAEVIQARHLDQLGIGVQELERLHALSPEQFRKQYEQDVKNLDLSKKIQTQWQNLSIQLSRAGLQIENVFVRGLSKLNDNGQLEHLSDSFVKVVDAFANSPAVQKWMGEFGDSLERFANYIGTDEFRKNVEGFVKGIGELAEDVVWALKKLGVIKSDGDSPASGTGKVVGSLPWGMGTLRRTDQNGPGGASGSWSNDATANADALSLVRQLERSGDSAVSPKGAIGRYQVTPGTALQYGGDPSRLSDPNYEAGIAGKIVSDLTRRYKGNTLEVLAAYNAGPGVADRFKRSGDDMSVLPKETQDYLKRAQGLPGYQPRITIEVLNNTGGSAIVQTAQAAY